MFWQVVLFIVIAFGVILVRALAKATSNEDMGGVSLVLSIGGLFYIAFAIQWSLRFLLDFTDLSYWTLMGLYVLRNVLFSQLKESEDY